MMEQREKLIELIGDSLCCPKETDCADCEYKKYELCTETMVADYLLANSVVVLPCRCGECKHFYKYNCHADNMRMNMCKLGVGTDGEDFYCPYGERKGGE